MELEPNEFIADEQRARLITVLDEIELHIKRQNSFKHTFFKGVIYGLGTVVGATILVALFGGFIAGTINTLTGETVVTETLEAAE